MTSIEYFSLFTKGRYSFAVALKTWVTTSLHKSFEMYAVLFHSIICKFDIVKSML